MCKSCWYNGNLKYMESNLKEILIKYLSLKNYLATLRQQCLALMNKKHHIHRDSITEKKCFYVNIEEFFTFLFKMLLSFNCHSRVSNCNSCIIFIIYSTGFWCSKYEAMVFRTCKWSGLRQNWLKYNRN